MRHLLHELFARYLDGEQYAFEATSRELWPERWSIGLPSVAGEAGGGQWLESNQRQPVRSELEPRH